MTISDGAQLYNDSSGECETIRFVSNGGTVVAISYPNDGSAPLQLTQQDVDKIDNGDHPFLTVIGE